jgi:putative ABC transport system substrate-binding protein
MPGYLRFFVFACLLAAIAVALAQPPARVYRVGLISGNASARDDAWRSIPNYRAFLEGMRQRGYVEGENTVLEFRSAEGNLEQLPAVAAALVQSRPDVILVPTCGAPLDAVRGATTTIPIVVAACTGDMVADGIVASLAHPGGNLTGQQKLNPEMAAKRLQLLKEVVPNASRAAVLWDPNYSDFAADWRALSSAAKALGVTLQSVESHRPAELESAFDAMASEHADALVTFSDSQTYLQAQDVANLAARHHLAGMYAYREIPTGGGLMSYGPSIPDMFRHAAVFVDKILQGAKPGDLPIEQPRRIEFVVNLKTAKALGLTIPKPVLMRADEVIE